MTILNGMSADNANDRQTRHDTEAREERPMRKIRKGQKDRKEGQRKADHIDVLDTPPTVKAFFDAIKRLLVKNQIIILKTLFLYCQREKVDYIVTSAEFRAWSLKNKDLLILPDAKMIRERRQREKGKQGGNTHEALDR